MNAVDSPPDSIDPWERLAAELRHPDLELDVETFAVVATAFHRRRRSGASVDPVLVSLMIVLSRQVLLTVDDVDAFTIGGERE